MSIQTLDAYIAAPKQRVAWSRLTTRTTVASSWFSLFDVAGQPGAGVLAGTNAANGVVPTQAIAGYPVITPFTGANKGYLGRSLIGSSVGCRVALFDRLYVSGAHNFNASQALSSQPSYAARLIGGSDYTNLEIWVEQVTAATGNQAVTVTYTDESGNAGATTGAVGIGAAPTVGRCWQLPLAAGDSGVQKLESVTGTVASAGTFNVMVLRPLGGWRVAGTNGFDPRDAIQNGLVELPSADVALYVLIAPDSTSSGVPEFNFEIAQG